MLQIFLADKREVTVLCGLVMVGVGGVGGGCAGASPGRPAGGAGGAVAGGAWCGVDRPARGPARSWWVDVVLSGVWYGGGVGGRLGPPVEEARMVHWVLYQVILCPLEHWRVEVSRVVVGWWA